MPTSLNADMERAIFYLKVVLGTGMSFINP